MGPCDPRQPRPVQLRLLGSVGEPINPEAGVGTAMSSAADAPLRHLRQTETGSDDLLLPGIAAAKPGETPLPGISAKIVDDHGDPLPPHNEGAQHVTAPCPNQPTKAVSMLRGTQRPCIGTLLVQLDKYTLPGRGCRPRRRDSGSLGRIDG